MIKTVVSLSGGLDSAVALYEAMQAGSMREVVWTFGFDYGSKHNYYEHKAAKRLALQAARPYEVLDLTPVMRGFQSDLMSSGGEVPEGHYEAESMRHTVVPGRNIIFLSILAGMAWSRKCEEVWIGIHAGDHFIYPDCRPEFFRSMDAAVQQGTDQNVRLIAPFLNMDKAQIVRRGMTLGVPFELTRTCYKNQPVACGKCGSCQERLNAFQMNGIADPLDYETREIIPKPASPSV